MIIKIWLYGLFRRKTNLDSKKLQIQSIQEVWYRVGDVESEKVACVNKEVAEFGVEVVVKDKNKFLELNAKFEKY